MKKLVVLFLFSCSTLSAQDDFVRGAFMFGNVNVDYTQLHDSLHLNWIQGQVDIENGTKLTNVLQNTGNLNVIGVSVQNDESSIYHLSSAKQMVFEAEERNNKLTSHEQKLLNRTCNGDTAAQKEFSARIVDKTPMNLKRFIIDVN
jgi:hypothetical protein